MWGSINWNPLPLAHDVSRAVRATGERVLEATIERHWGTIQGLFRDTVIPAALRLAKNDDAIRYAGETVYQALPGIVRIIVRQDAFVRFCLSNRDRILACLPKDAPTGQDDPDAEGSPDASAESDPADDRVGEHCLA